VISLKRIRTGKVNIDPCLCSNKLLHVDLQEYTLKLPVNILYTSSNPAPTGPDVR